MDRALALRMMVMAGIAVVLAKVLISCVDLESLGNGPPDGATTEDASLPDVVDPCSHDQPAATSSVDDGAGELPTFVLAVDTVTLDPKKVTPLDLDGVCTCDTRPGSARDGGPSCVAAAVSCDGDGGADNTLGAVAVDSAPVVSVAAASNRLIAAGHRTLLLQIQGYNGLANDREVVVGTLVGVGIHTRGCPFSTFDTATKLWSVGGCGDDPWTLSPTSGVPTGTGITPFVRGTGYVLNHQLVVRLNDAVPIPFNDESSITFRVPFLGGLLVPLGEDLAPRDPARAPTEKEKRLFRLENGVLAGRILATEVLSTLGSYLQPASGTRLCTSAGFGIARDRICGAVDILGKPPLDPARSCDALSGALGFVAIPAVTAYVSDAGALSTGCESVDASIFTCP